MCTLKPIFIGVINLSRNPETVLKDKKDNENVYCFASNNKCIALIEILALKCAVILIKESHDRCSC